MAFQVSNVIPLSSPVIENIILGSEKRVMDCFARRSATPFDVDPLGRSLLHWAMDQVRPNVSRVLIENGADPYAVESTGKVVSQFEVWGLDQANGTQDAGRHLLGETAQAL